MDAVLRLARVPMRVSPSGGGKVAVVIAVAGVGTRRGPIAAAATKLAEAKGPAHAV